MNLAAPLCGDDIIFDDIIRQRQTFAKGITFHSMSIVKIVP